MKLILMSIAAFLMLTVPVFSELTAEDLEKIRSITKESEERMKEYVQQSEERVKEYVDIKINGISDKVDINIKSVGDTIDEMDKRLNLIFSLVVALIALVVLAVGVPQIIVM